MAHTETQRSRSSVASVSLCEKKRSRRSMNLKFLAILSLTLASPAAAQVDSALFGGLRYRMIGPSRGGRVTTVTGVPSQPLTFYQGSTGGGVWKTTNAGTT